jgi:hypothetical protein
METMIADDFSPEHPYNHPRYPELDIKDAFAKVRSWQAQMLSLKGSSK